VSAYLEAPRASDFPPGGLGAELAGVVSAMQIESAAPGAIECRPIEARRQDGSR